eukprot:snap_masked-scaffold_4-processed-gene-15.28-mRNA-1 protein AED:1.00 eAED:1.00 QI:0/0/0/0/1/1/2/0/67
MHRVGRISSTYSCQYPDKVVSVPGTDVRQATQAHSGYVILLNQITRPGIMFLDNVMRIKYVILQQEF